VRAELPEAIRLQAVWRRHSRRHVHQRRPRQGPPPSKLPVPLREHWLRPHHLPELKRLTLQLRLWRPPESPVVRRQLVVLALALQATASKPSSSGRTTPISTWRQRATVK